MPMQRERDAIFRHYLCVGGDRHFRDHARDDYE